MKRVRETNAGKSISAYVILNRKGEHVATVQAHFADSGRVTVDIWHTAHDEEKPWTSLQQGSAGGYGYDKFTAALSGLIVDGHKLTDHCGESATPPKGRKTWPQGAKPPQGFSFANWINADRSENGEEGWTSCYRLEGLRYLEAIGYRVIQAI